MGDALSDPRECPYCLTPIGQDNPTTACDLCGRSHHTECWLENDGCCASDCGGARRRLDVQVEPRPLRISLTREAVEAAAPRAGGSVNPCIRCGKPVPEGEIHCVECEPGPEPDPDAANLAPMLLLVGLLAVVLAWLIAGGVLTGGESPSTETPYANPVHTKR